MVWYGIVCALSTHPTGMVSIVVVHMYGLIHSGRNLPIWKIYNQLFTNEEVN